MASTTLPGDGSLLHKERCPACQRDWQHMVNDLERLAHLVLCTWGFVLGACATAEEEA